MKKQIEIERKFVIKMPSLESLKAEKDHTESDIVQIYLESERGVTHRIRSRKFSGKTTYTETVKRRIDAMSAVEEEGEISASEFERLSGKIRVGTRPIIKTRHTFFYEGQTVEIDIYPDWQRSAVLEVELPDRAAEIKLPEFIEIISEVTGDFRYSNASMAAAFPSELI